MTTRKAAPARCDWCARELPNQEGVGRRRRYCGQSCRQRSYESRQALVRGDLPADSVVLTADEAVDLADRLYQVRCAAEDVATALGEKAAMSDLTDLIKEMLTAAREAERLR